MNLFVKAKDLGGVEHTIFCDDPKRALEVEKDEKATGCEVWVEDANGRRLDDAGLRDLAGKDRQAPGEIPLKDEGARGLQSGGSSRS